MIRNFINLVLSKYFISNYKNIENFKNDPLKYQELWFYRLINLAKNTEWGKKNNYDKIKGIKDFKKFVEIQDYDSLKPYINKIIKGEQNILCKSNIKWFAKSSGTTSDKSKFIPVSTNSLQKGHFKGGKDLISTYYNNFPNSNMFNGRGLVLGGSTEINKLNKSTYYADLSAVIIKNLPFWAGFHKTPNKNIGLMNEWEEKINSMARITANQNITNISGVPSWTLVLLKKILKQTNKKYIKDVWPNLELYVHGGVSFDPYREQYESIIGKQICYQEVYNASEGFFAVQDTFGEKDNGLLLLLNHGIFYEFLPISELYKNKPKTKQLSEVNKDENYALIISTNGGLWRYMIGDTVKFTSTTPYRIKITGRTKHYINVFGEELIIDNAENALKIANKKHNSFIKDYTVAPVFMNEKNTSGIHEWVIEFEKKPNNLKEFTNTLDNALKSINSDYEAKRYKNMVLQKLHINVVEKNTFYNWLKSRNKLGGQNKVPRLYNNRKYLNDILKFHNKNC